MKKTLLFIAVALTLGSFSIVDAAVLYEQPSTSTVITYTSATQLFFSCAEISYSTSDLDTVTFYAGGDYNLNTWTVNMFTSSSTDCSSYTYIGQVSPSATTTNVFYTLDASVLNKNLTGIRSVAIEVYKTSGPMVGTPSTLGTTGASAPPGYNNNPYLLLTDEGSSESINWYDLSVVPPIDFEALKFVATSTSFFSGQASGTLQAIANECAQTGNIFAEALCRTTAYLFIPNPAVLDQYTTLASSTADKFPFSYIFGVIYLFTELNASSTTNMIAPHIDFSSVDPASSTPFGSFLPDMTIMSSTSIKQYMPEGFWELVYALMIAAIWLGLAFMLVKEALNLINVRHQ